MVGNYDWRKFYREGIEMGGNSIAGTFFGREIVFGGNLKGIFCRGGILSVDKSGGKLVGGTVRGGVDLEPFRR